MNWRTTCPNSFAEQTLRAVTSWGRFAEAFAYDEATGVFSLDNPV
jgi:NitT/TauT family transport system ATP-binding protein